MTDRKNFKFYFFALMAWGEGISGGDRISIEFARRFSKKFPVVIYLWEQGYRMYLRHNLKGSNIKYMVVNMSPWKYFGFVINYFARIFAGILIAFRLDLDNKKNTIVYSATEFWMDSLPGFILRMRYPNITWVATWFQTAPNPLKGFREGDRAQSFRFHAFAYWLVQLPIKFLIKRGADFVLVNNEEEKSQFPKMNERGKVIVVLGAVDISMIKNMLSKAGKEDKVFDGVFQGRFHPQKGIVELIDIWKLVVDQKSDAKLALIGDGPLMKKVRQKIYQLSLQKNIKLFGFMFDGIKKYQIFQQSRVVLHPAFYDSGGMAAAEAMALGLPAVGFNLAAYRSYYPKGMVKVPLNNLSAFAQAILNFLNDQKLYTKMANEAKVMISQNWSWDKRAEEILHCISRG